MMKSSISDWHCQKFCGKIVHAKVTILQKIIAAVDADKNGTIEFDEFVDFFMNLGPKIQT